MATGAALLAAPAIRRARGADAPLKIGNTMPYSGPASAYSSVGKADSAFFKMVNDQGGVAGRKVNFISLDDSYSPPKTVEDVRRHLTPQLVADTNTVLIAIDLGRGRNRLGGSILAQVTQQGFQAIEGNRANQPRVAARVVADRAAKL